MENLVYVTFYPMLGCNRIPNFDALPTRQRRLQEYFQGWLLRNLNYTKFNKNKISYIGQKKEKHIHTQ